MGRSIIVDQDTGEFLGYAGNSPGYNQRFNGGGNRSYNRGNNYGGGNRSQKKHSGAKVINISKGKNKGKRGISAWNYSRQAGLVSLLLTPYSGTDKHESKSGRVWENWMVKAFYKRTGQTVMMSALYDPQRGYAIVKDLGYKVNPGAPNGGYCGTFVNKGRR